MTTARICALAAAVMAGLLLLRAWPRPALAGALQASTVIFAQDGSLLRVTLAQDGQYRIWVPLETMPPRLAAAVVLYEDRWFYRHLGVNPVALLRAAANNSSGGRRLGASTITMQLARRLYRLNTRTWHGKLHQIGTALWLEARYGKREILEAYLNVAPYGGNVEGVGAASLVLFGRRVTDLSVPQSMTLAVIPQNPRMRRPPATAAAPGPLDEARLRLWTRWLVLHPEDARFSGDLAARVPAGGPEGLPFRAPHFTDAILREHSGDLHTTLDPRRQRTVERLLHDYVDVQAPIGIRNAGALLLEVTPDGAARVRAYVGSADYHDTAIDGQVNAVTAKRSPGSTLKPFVYALAIDQGLIHPRTILKDTPTSFASFSPENFDGRFVGPIAAEDALIRSRNVPAVIVASMLGHPNLYDFLKAAGVSRLNSERYYGLALTLGGGDVSMEELGRMYAVLLNDGRPAPLQMVSEAAATGANGERLLSPEASFITLDMLAKNPRPDTGQPATPAVAWKTGTSWGFRDAWAVGIFGRQVLVVWIGNFDNTANPAFVGLQAAAPLLFRIIDSIRAEGLDVGPVAQGAARNLKQVEVCAASGDLPNAECPRTVPTWYIPGKSPIRVSQLHRRIYLDEAGRRVCEAGPDVRSEVFEFWSSDMLRLFREAGVPRRVPPPDPGCVDPGVNGADGPQIVSPLRGVVYTLRLKSFQPLALRATVGAGAQTTYWFADKDFLGQTTHGDALTWMPPQPGHYSLRAVDDMGAVDTRDIDVDLVP